MTAVAGAVNLLAQGALQAADHLGAGPAQEAPRIQGIGEHTAGLAAPDGHRHIGDLRPEDGPGFVRRLAAVNRHLVPGRGQAPGQVLHRSLGPARAADPLSQEGDFHEVDSEQ